MEGWGESKDQCPPAQFSLSAFPITRQSLLISKDTALKRNSFSLSLSLSLDEKEKKERKVWKRKSVISNREKVLPQQTISPPLSLSHPIPSSLSPSLVILLLVRVPIVYPRPPATPFRPFINRGIAHPRKYGVRKSFKLPHGRSFAFLFKPR